MTRGVFFLASAIVIAIVSFISISPALAQRPQASEAFVEEVEIRGNRRIPRESVLYYVQSKPQDRFDLSLAQRDLQSIIQMGMFDPLSTKLFVEDGPRGGKIIIFQVKEYPIIRAIEYRGMKSATESEVLTRWKERSVQVSKELTFDPAKINRARLVLRELLAEKGHPNAEVAVEVEEISATTVGLVFEVEEGKRVRVKEIQFMGERDGSRSAPAARGDETGQGGGPLLELHVEGHLLQREADGRPRACALLPRDERLPAGQARRAEGGGGGEGFERVAVAAVPQVRSRAEN